MNELLDFFTDITVAAAMTTASHFGLSVEHADARSQAAVESHRTVRRTAVGASSARPTPRTIRAAAR